MLTAKLVGDLLREQTDSSLLKPTLALFGETFAAFCDTGRTSHGRGRWSHVVILWRLGNLSGLCDDFSDALLLAESGLDRVDRGVEIRSSLDRRAPRSVVKPRIV
jgi:hypothetical protein